MDFQAAVDGYCTIWDKGFVVSIFPGAACLYAQGLYSNPLYSSVQVVTGKAYGFKIA